MHLCIDCIFLYRKTLRVVELLFFFFVSKKIPNIQDQGLRCSSQNNAWQTSSTKHTKPDWFTWRGSLVFNHRLGQSLSSGLIVEGLRHLTAFTTPWGIYEWIRIPFRQSNAPAAFQRSMEEKLDIPYLDDVLCFSKFFEEHVQVLWWVLQVLQGHGGQKRLPLY